MEDDDLVTGKKRKRSLSQGGDEEEVHEFAMTVPEVTPETSDADVSRLFNRMVWGTKMHPQLERDLQDAMKSAQRKKRRVRGGSEEASEDGSGAHGQTADDVMREIGMLEDNAPPAPGSVHSDDVDVFAASEAEEAKGDDEMSVDSHIDVQAKRKARNFFDDTTHDDAEERAAFANIEAAQQHNVRNLQAVIPPADLKRLYLRQEDHRIRETDFPERYQLQLQDLGWDQDTVREELFNESGDRSLLQRMGTFVQDRVFKDHARPMELVEKVLTLIFRHTCEPVFIQLHCLNEEERDLVSHDDSWNIWNAAFEFVAVYQRRSALHENLYPVHEALAEGLYSESRKLTRYACPTQGRKMKLMQALTKHLECVSHDLHNVSFADLGKSPVGEVAKWTWRPHYLTWVEQWISHWDDVFDTLSKQQKTQTAYHKNSNRRDPQKRSHAIRYRKEGQLYYFAMQFTCHPSTIAYYLTSPTNDNIKHALTGGVPRADLDEADREAILGIRFQASTRPPNPPAEKFEGWLEELKQWKPNQWGPNDVPEKLRGACNEMVAGSLSMEPRFRQLIMNLVKGYDDQSVVALGRIRVQPSVDGVGYFKQGGDRVGYRNLCLNSRKWTTDLKEEIVRFVGSGLMQWWIEIDDPKFIQNEIELEYQKAEGMTESMSQATATTQAGILVNEVNRMNTLRDALCDQTGRSRNPSIENQETDETFEDFRKRIKDRKVNIILDLLRNAHREPHARRTAKLPFIPLDDWYTSSTPSTSTETDHTIQEWIEVRIAIVKSAISKCLHDIEETIWNEIHEHVQEKILAESAKNLRTLAIRSGYHGYKVKGTDTGEGHRLRTLDEDMFTARDSGDYMPDPSDTTLPGAHRIAGIVYDDATKQHTVAFLDAHGNYCASFELEHFAMREEDSLVREKLEAMQVQLRKHVFTHRPDAWAIGMTDATDLQIREMLRKFNVDWQSMLDDEDLRNLFPAGYKLPRVEMVDSRVARVWARSRSAEVELRDLDESRRKAVAIARTLRSPISAIASLFTADLDCLNLSLTEMQDAVPRKTFLRRLEQQMVSIIGTTGIDINYVINPSSRSEHSVLQFLPGMGPRKAAHLLRAVAGSALQIDSRQALMYPPFNITPVVFMNLAGFVRVMLPDADYKAHKHDYEDDVSEYDEDDNLKEKKKKEFHPPYLYNLDRTRIHPMYYPIVYEIARLLQVATSRKDMMDYDKIIDEIGDDTEVLHAESEELLREAAETEYLGIPHQAAVREVEVSAVQRSMEERAMEGQSVADLMKEDLHRMVVPDMSMSHIVKVILDEFLIGPYRIKAASAEDDLYTLAEYRPYNDESLFDSLVDDPTLIVGSLRIVTVADTASHGVKVRIAGCDAARGFIPKTETVPGKAYSDNEWNSYRNVWFKRAQQYEAVVTHVRKANFSIALTIIPELVSEVKRKTDKTYKALQKQIENREKRVDDDGKTVAASQTGTLAETVSQDRTLSILGGGTNTSMIYSTFESQQDGEAGEGGGFGVGKGAFDGALNSHPLFIGSDKTTREVYLLLNARDAHGRPLHRDGHGFMRPNLTSTSKTSYLLDLKMGEVYVYDEQGLLGDKKRTVTLPAYMTLKFDVRGMHGGMKGIQMRERRPGTNKTEEADEFMPDEEKYEVHNFEDVDHMLYSNRIWLTKLEELHAHKHWFNGSYRQARDAVVKESKQKNLNKTPFRICPMHYTTATDPVTREVVPAIKTVINDLPGFKYNPNPMQFMIVSVGVTEEERKEGRVRKWVFEAKRNFYQLLTTADKDLKNPHVEYPDLKSVEDEFQKQFRQLIKTRQSRTKKPKEMFHSGSHRLSQASPSVPMGGRFHD